MSDHVVNYRHEPAPGVVPWVEHDGPFCDCRWTENPDAATWADAWRKFADSMKPQP